MRSTPVAPRENGCKNRYCGRRHCNEVGCREAGGRKEEAGSGKGEKTNKTIGGFGV
jgi:hypothetical protein